MTKRRTEIEETANAMAEFYADAARRTRAPLEDVILPLTRQLATLATMFEDVKDEADRDVLTGLFSRRRILQHLSLEVSRTRRQGLPTTVVMVDLDHFKRVNDDHGHLVGDRVLVDVGEAIRGVLRTTDAAGRYGGEEILLVLSGKTNAKVAGEKFREAVASVRVLTDAGRVVRPTASLGVAVYDQDFRGPSTVEELLKKADEALYRAKSLGRNRVVVS